MALTNDRDYSQLLPPLPSPLSLMTTAPAAASADGTMAAPATPPPMNYLRPIIQPPQPSQQTQNDAAELARLQSTGSGVHQFQQHHHILGTLARIGDVAGSILFPGATAMIPGTTLHHNLLVNDAQGNVAQDVANDERTAQEGADNARAGAENAQADESEARAYALTHPQPKPAAAPKPESPKPIQYTVDGKTPLWGAFHDGKIYDMEGNAVPNAQTFVKPAAAHAKTAFEEWLDNPATYEKFLQAEQAAKGSGQHPTGMGMYSAMRAIEAASRIDPRIEPLIPFFLKAAGIDVPSGIDFSKPPAGQPQNEQGAPIGTSMPGAPTTQRRNAGQQAADILPQITDAEARIKDISDQIGPGEGRLYDVWVGRVGANDPKYAALKAQLELIAGAFNKAHLNTELGYRDFGDLLRTAQTPQNLIAILERVKSLAQTYKAAGEGHPAGETSRASKESGPASAEVMIQAPDGRKLMIPKENLQKAIQLGAKEISQ